MTNETMNSTSDDRTKNDTMRHKYRVLTDEEKWQMGEVKDFGTTFINVCDAIGQSRELSIAKTKMEEAVMLKMTHGYNDDTMWQDIIFLAVVFFPVGIVIGYWIWG